MFWSTATAFPEQSERETNNEGLIIIHHSMSAWRISRSSRMFSAIVP